MVKFLISTAFSFAMFVMRGDTTQCGCLKMHFIRGCLFEARCLLEEILYFYKTSRDDTHMTSTLRGRGEDKTEMKCYRT